MRRNRQPWVYLSSSCLTPTSVSIGVHQVINQASGRISHHTVHTQPVGRRFDRVDDFFIPASSLIINHIRYVQYDPRALLMQIDLQIKFTPLAFYSLLFPLDPILQQWFGCAFRVRAAVCLSVNVVMEVFGERPGYHLHRRTVANHLE